MVNIENKKFDAQFYATWVLINIISGVAAFTAYLVIAKIYNAVVGEWIVVNGEALIAENYLPPYIFSSLGIDPYSIVSGVFALMLVGGFLGAAQWLVLRRHVLNAVWWIPASMLGWGSVGVTGSIGVFSALVYPAVATGLALYFLLKPSQQVKISE